MFSVNCELLFIAAEKSKLTISKDKNLRQQELPKVLVNKESEAAGSVAEGHLEGAVEGRYASGQHVRWLPDWRNLSSLTQLTGVVTNTVN